MKKKGVITEDKKPEVRKQRRKTKDPMFVGLDPSYNSFGLIVLDQSGEIIEQKILESKTKEEAEDRIIALEKGFDFIPNILGLQSVYMEGPSYSSNGGFVLQMGALHYYLRIFFRKKNIEYKIIAPGTLKKFVTGAGNAKKDLMLLKTYKKWGVEFSVSDLADAYGLAQMSLYDYKNP